MNRRSLLPHSSPTLLHRHTITITIFHNHLLRLSLESSNSDPHHHQTLSFSEEIAEEELEWLSNKDAFPAMETCFDILSANHCPSCGTTPVPYPLCTEPPLPSCLHHLTSSNNSMLTTDAAASYICGQFAAAGGMFYYLFGFALALFSGPNACCREHFGFRSIT